MEIKQSTSFKVPIRMKLTADGTDKTGLTYSDVTVYVQKQAGVSTLKTLTSALEWVEIDSTNMPGAYDLLLATSDTDTGGFIKYTVSAALCVSYYGLL